MFLQTCSFSLFPASLCSPAVVLPSVCCQMTTRITQDMNHRQRFIFLYFCTLSFFCFFLFYQNGKLIVGAKTVLLTDAVTMTGRLVRAQQVPLPTPTLWYPRPPTRCVCPLPPTPHLSAVLPTTHLFCLSPLTARTRSLL